KRHGLLQRPDGLFSPPGRSQRLAQADECICELRIQACRAPEALNGVVPVARLAGHLSQFVLGCRVAGINSQFLLKLRSRLVESVRSTISGQEQVPQLVVNAGQVRPE